MIWFNGVAIFQVKITYQWYLHKPGCNQWNLYTLQKQQLNVSTE